MTGMYDPGGFPMCCPVVLAMMLVFPSGCILWSEGGCFVFS